jgi:hypothetical protein
VDALTAEDYESVERAGRVLYERGWRQPFSVNEVVDAWRVLIEQVEQGYDDVVYEYINDLSCRDWLALAWPMLTDRVRSARHPELESLDARFMAATTEDKEGRLALYRRAGTDDGWWWGRLPTRRTGEFAGDLE